MSFLTLKNISKKYGKNQILQNQDFTFNRQEIVFLAGKNGVGKTTLMEIIMGINRIDGGGIQLDGHDLQIPYKIAMRHYFSFLPTGNQLMDYLNAEENLTYFSEVYQVQGYKNKIPQMMNTHSFMADKSRLFKDYSTGMKQELNLVLIDLLDTPIILLDEPSLGLDAYHMNLLCQRILKYKESGKLVIIASHDLLLCQRLADRIYLFSNNDISEYHDQNQINKIEENLLASYS